MAQLEGYGDSSLRDVEIRRSDPYLSVSLRDNGAWVYSSDDDPVTGGIHHTMLGIVARRRRPVLGIVRDRWWVWGAIVVLALVGGSLLTRDDPWLMGTGAALMILGVVALVGSWFATLRGSVLVPVYRRDAPSFFKRNRDNLILVFGGAVVGAVVTWALSQL